MKKRNSLLAGVVTGVLFVGGLLWLMACGPPAPPPATPTPVPTVPAGYQRICYVTDVRLGCPFYNQDCSINIVEVTKTTECVVVPVWRP